MLSNYPNILMALRRAVWCMDTGVFQSWTEFVRNGSRAAETGSRSVGGKPYNVGEIRVVPMFGAIGKYLSQMEIECTGACDVSALQNYLIEADADESVSAVVLHVNSPGGTVTGIPEVASVIAGMVKPIVAYCDSMMASAAYWIGSGCDEILVSSTADVGSIGVFQAWVDPSKNMEKNGFELKVIRAGTHKAAWLPGMMDDESFALMQAQVDSVYAMFSSHVVAMRGAIASEVMQGQSFLGETAVVVGLADQVVNGIGDAIERARTLSTGESNEIS